MALGSRPRPQNVSRGNPKKQQIWAGNHTVCTAEIVWFTCLIGVLSLPYAQLQSIKPRMPYGHPE